MSSAQTPPRKKARELAKHLRGERPDYMYMKELFRYLRQELELSRPRTPQRLPVVPTWTGSDEMSGFWEVISPRSRGLCYTSASRLSPGR